MLGEADAKVLSQEFGSGIVPGQFSQLGNFEVLVKLLSNGKLHEPFTGKTLAPLELRGGRRDAVVASSRCRYASRKDVVENKIARWMGNRL